MANKSFQKGFALGFASRGITTVGDTDKIDNLEVLIDESGILEEGEYTLTEKVQQLIDIIKKYQDDNPESVIIENILTTSEGYILTDKDGLYITTKESE